MRHTIGRALVILAIAAFSFLYLVAVPASARMCFRGKPAPACKTFWITEFGLGYMPKTYDPICLSSEIGWMVNYRERYAIGGTTYIAFDNNLECVRGGLKLRVRRWMSPNWSMNFAGGPILGRTWSGGDVQPGFAGHVDVNYKDRVAPYIGMDLLKGGLEGGGLHAGIRLGPPGWRVGVIGLAVAAAVGFIYAVYVGTAP
ncbi:MAG: hypothetical protein V1694_04280 [Candidatus Eisenbacteria bacterium]